MECGSEASAHAEADASALQTCPRAAPLSHRVGEGLGVRAEGGRALHTVNPSDVPLSALNSPVNRGGAAAPSPSAGRVGVGAMFKSLCTGTCQSPNQSSQQAVVANPLLKVPPASRGNRRGRFPSRSGGNLKEGGSIHGFCACQRCFFALNAGTIHLTNPTNAVGVRSKPRRNYERGGNRCETP